MIAVRLERKPEVLARSGLTPSALDRLVRAGRFPLPVRIGGTRALGWRSEEVDAWLQAQPRIERPAKAVDHV